MLKDKEIFIEKLRAYKCKILSSGLHTPKQKSTGILFVIFRPVLICGMVSYKSNFFYYISSLSTISKVTTRRIFPCIRLFETAIQTAFFHQSKKGISAKNLLYSGI